MIFKTAKDLFTALLNGKKFYTSDKYLLYYEDGLFYSKYKNSINNQCNGNNYINIELEEAVEWHERKPFIETLCWIGARSIAIITNKNDADVFIDTDGVGWSNAIPCISNDLSKFLLENQKQYN